MTSVPVKYFRYPPAYTTPKIIDGSNCKACGHWKQSANKFFPQNGDCTLKNKPVKSYNTCGYFDKNVIEEF